MQISLFPHLSFYTQNILYPPLSPLALPKSSEYLQAETSSQASCTGTAHPVSEQSTHPHMVDIFQFPEKLILLKQNQVFVFFQLKEGGAKNY